MDALALVDDWPVEDAAVLVVGPDGPIAARGDLERTYRLASVTKLFVAYACLIAWQEGVLDLDAPAGPPGATVRHLLAHASGLGFDDTVPASPVGRRRAYSNPGFERLGDIVFTVAFALVLRPAPATRSRHGVPLVARRSQT